MSAVRPAMRPRPVLLTAIVLVVVSVALGTPTLAGASRSGARHGLGGVPARVGSLASPSDTGASDLVNLGTGGWQVASSATATQPGADFHARLRHHLMAVGRQRRRGRARHRDRGAAAERPVPERVLLHQHEAVLRLDEPGRGGHRSAVRGAVVVADRLPRLPRAGQHAVLVVNGVVGAAEVWVNGHRGGRRRDRHRRLHPVRLRRSPGCCAAARTRWPSRSSRTTRTRCSRSTTWTGTRSRRTTTPASSSPSSSQVAGPLADGNAHVIEHNAPA